MPDETTIKLLPASEHILTLRNDMLKALRFFFPADVITTVDSHDGDFGPEEIEKYAKTAPAIILVMNGGKPTRRGGIINESMTTDLFIMTTGTTSRQRTDGCLLIYEHFLKLLFDTDWNTQECVGDPGDVASKNLYDGEVDDLGLALWMVRWQQLVQIPYLTDEEAAALPNFATLFAKYTNFRPTEDPADTAASEQAIELETT